MSGPPRPGVVAALALMVLLASGGAAAAVTDPFESALPSVHVFTDRDGLPQNSVESMAIDGLGRLWATTREGMAIYDGSQWQSLSLPEDTPSNWPRSVAVLPDGAVWIGAEQGGVYRYLDGRWSRFDRSSGLPSDRVRIVAEVKVGRERSLIAGTTAGMAIWDDDEKRFQAYPVLSGMEVISLLSTPDGDLWVGTRHDGAFRCDGSDCRNVTPERFDEIGVMAMIEFETGLLFGTSQGLFRFDDGDWEQIGVDEIGDASVTDLIEVGEGTSGTVWVSTEGRGVKTFDRLGWNTLDVDSGMPNNFVFDLLAWPESASPELIYAGTLSGLAVIDRDGWRRIELKPSLTDQSVVSFLESTWEGESRFWVGTTHGLASFVDGEWVNVLSDESVFALEQLRNGEIYAGATEGLLKLEQGRWVDAGKGLPDSSVVAIAEEVVGDSSRLWVGTYGGGVWVLDGDLFRRAASLPDERVEAILPVEIDGRSRVLVGTNRGLVIIEGGDSSIITSKSGLPNDVVRALHIRELKDGSRQLWVGTGGGAAWTSLSGTFEWHVIDGETEPALPSNTVYRIEEDDAGRIHLFTTRGVLRLATDGQGIDGRRVFATADGLPSNEINFGATMVDSRGRIWAGTPMGAAIFDPRRERDDPPGRLVIDSIRIDREPVERADSYELNPDQRSLAIDVRLIDLDGGAAAQYRSRLVGVESEPGPWSSSPRVELTGLAPGRYQLLVEAMDDVGRIYGPVEIPFRIASPWWSSVSAIVIYVILGLLLLGALMQWRMRSLRRRTVELERLVRSRTLDLERSNRELEAANRSLWAMTETDPLTGAKNRRWVTLHLESEADRVAQSSRRGDNLILILVDIDHFKAVNDRFGHAVGDAVLRHFKEVLARTVRDSDTIVRWGGEEFLVIARKTSREEAPLIAERIVDEVRREPFEPGEGKKVHLTCSVGISPFPFDQERRDLISWQDVLAITDHSMYTVKNSGRDGWVAIFSGEAEPPADLLERLRTSPEKLRDAGIIRVESSFEPSAVTWPPPEPEAG